LSKQSATMSFTNNVVASGCGRLEHVPYAEWTFPPPWRMPKTQTRETNHRSLVANWVSALLPVRLHEMIASRGSKLASDPPATRSASAKLRHRILRSCYRRSDEVRDGSRNPSIQVSLHAIPSSLEEGRSVPKFPQPHILAEPRQCSLKCLSGASSFHKNTVSNIELQPSKRDFQTHT
jgi:hypothetical protein